MGGFGQCKRSRDKEKAPPQKTRRPRILRVDRRRWGSGPWRRVSEDSGNPEENRMEMGRTKGKRTWHSRQKSQIWTRPKPFDESSRDEARHAVMPVGSLTDSLLILNWRWGKQMTSESAVFCLLTEGGI